MQNSQLEIVSAEGDAKSGSPQARSKLRTTVVLPLIISLFGLIVALLLLEIGIRLAGLINPPANPWNDRPKGYFLSESSLTVRDFAYETLKPKGTWRMAVIGDSFTFGPLLQFDDTFSKRLERFLNLNKKQPPVEVLNLGVSGYATVHEVEMVKKALLREPDLILLQITLNDPEIQISHKHVPNGAQYAHHLATRNFLVRWSKLLQLIITRIHNNQTIDNYLNFYHSIFKNPATWDPFQNSIRSIRDISRHQNVPIVAVLFPLFSHPFDKHYPFIKEHEKVAALLKDLEIPYLDLRTAYDGIPPERLQVFPGVDLHPNEIAHRIAAESIYKWLRTTRLVPKKVFAKSVVRDRSGIMKVIPPPMPKNHTHKNIRRKRAAA